MNDVVLALQAAWKVLLVGLLLGAGLPVVFAAGLRSLAWSNGDTGGSASAPSRLGRPVAYVCFAVVLIGVILGLVAIVADGAGKELAFSHVVVPVLQDKE